MATGKNKNNNRSAAKKTDEKKNKTKVLDYSSVKIRGEVRQIILIDGHRRKLRWDIDNSRYLLTSQPMTITDKGERKYAKEVVLDVIETKKFDEAKVHFIKEFVDIAVELKAKYKL